MLTKILPYLKGFIVCLFWILIVGCNGDSNPTFELTSSPLPTATTPPVTITKMPSVTPTMVIPSQTSTPLSTNTVFSSPTPRPTSTRPPTLTPLPTVPPDEAAIFVAELQENNAGCMLPCWWGIIPGETHWSEARNFLETFATDIVVGGLGGGRSGYGVFVPSPLTGGSIVYSFFVFDNVVTGIGIGYGEIRWKHYRIHEILNTYGQPTEVWVQTYLTIPYAYRPFRVVLFYPDQGIIVLYENDGASRDGQIVGCPQELDVYPNLSEPPRLPRLWLYSPDENATFMETAEQVESYIETEIYLPLEQAADMDIEAFYQTFKEVDNTVCISTPQSLWP